MKSTIREVAKLAGVSIGSVSNVFNGRRVRKDIYQRVMEAASVLEYTPYAVARKLALKKTKSIGLFILHRGKEMFITGLWGFLTSLIHGIFKVAEARDYSFYLDFSSLSKIKKKDLLNKIVKERALDGMIIFLRCPIDCKLVAEIERKNFPTILVNAGLSGVNIPSIEVNNFKGAKEAIDYLIKLGHSRIAMITGPLEFLDVKERIKGYKQSLKEHDIPYDPELIKEGDWMFKTGYFHTKELINLKKPPTAIFCANDPMAAGAIKAIKEEKMLVPEDISIIGFDDQVSAKMLEPPLTTVRQPLYQLGVLSAKKLFDIIDGKNSGPTKKILDPKLIIRDSCTSPKNASKRK